MKILKFPSGKTLASDEIKLRTIIINEVNLIKVE